MSKMLKTIIVTGCNKGIGYGVVDNLAGKSGWDIIMACRNKALANQSLSKLRAKHPSAKLSVMDLDVSQQSSISRFVETLSRQNRQVDVLVNNAGIAWKGDLLNEQVVRTTFATNFYGTITFSEAIIDIMRQKGKIITLGSSLGKYKWVPNPQIAQRLRNPNLTKEELFRIMKQFERAVKDNTHKQKGYPISAYMMSKLGINVYTTQILPKMSKIESKQIQIYDQCPGYVNTDMTDHKGFLSLEKGALTTVYLAELPFEVNPDLQGKFFEKCKVSSL